VAANITERLLSQFYMQKETGYELRQSGDTTHARKEVTTGNIQTRVSSIFIVIISFAFRVYGSTGKFHALVVDSFDFRRTKLRPSELKQRQKKKKVFKLILFTSPD